MTHYFFLSLNISEKKGRDLKREEERSGGNGEDRASSGEQVAALRVCRSHAKRCASGLIHVPLFGPLPLAAPSSLPQPAPGCPPPPPSPEANLVPGSVGRGRLRQDSQDSTESLSVVGVVISFKKGGGAENRQQR